MTPAELQDYLHDRIPLSRAMSVSVLAVADDEVVLEAPLAPNINHQGSVFGGSAASLATLAAWCLLHVRLAGGARLVIQHQTMAFHRPITGTFRARARLDQPEEWQRFERTLARKGRARMSLSAVLEYEEEIAGRFNGDFVAVSESRRGEGAGAPVDVKEVPTEETPAEEPPAEEPPAEEPPEEEPPEEEPPGEEPLGEEPPGEEPPGEEPPGEEPPAEEPPAEKAPVEKAPAEEVPANTHVSRGATDKPAKPPPGPGDKPGPARKPEFAVRMGGERRRPRPADEVPDFVRRAIDARKLMPAFEARPDDQREEYLAWIVGAEKAATQGRRLNQMLDELERGDRFMGTLWRPGARGPKRR